MLRLLMRQRRRLLLSALFASLGLMLKVSSLEIYDLSSFPWPIAALALLLTTVIVALGVALIGCAVILLLPRWRIMLELCALALFINGALSRFAPSVYDIPFIGGFMPFIVTMSVFALIYGEMLDRFRIRFDHRARRSFTSPLDADTLWRQLVPGEDTVDRHWDPLLHDLTPHEDDPDSFEARYTHGISLYEMQTMTFLEKSAPAHAKYYHVGQVEPRNRSLVEGIYEITITPLGDRPGCRVTLKSDMTEALPRVALMQWLDDDLGDRADYLYARQHGRRDWTMSGLYRRKVMRFA